jgi:proteasome activator subunit 4
MGCIILCISQVTWHVPNAEEIDFSLRIFKELTEPTLTLLDRLLEPGVTRDAKWRNDFCRHLSFVRCAFSGVPTLAKEVMPLGQSVVSAATSDILGEIPEMIGTAEAIESGFCLTDIDDPRHQYFTSIRRRFGQFLHRASVSLRQQGEENTVDAAHMLVRPVTFH